MRSAKRQKDHQRARRRVDSSHGADQERTSAKCRTWWMSGARGSRCSVNGGGVADTKSTSADMAEQSKVGHDPMKRF